MNNSLVEKEIKRLKPVTIGEMKRDYRQDTGLILRDISIKYRMTFAAACFIVKTG